MTVSQNELLEALRLALTPQGDDAPGALTTRELCAVLGISDKRLRPLLWSIKDQGALEVVSVRRPNLAGQVVQVPAYTLARQE